MARSVQKRAGGAGKTSERARYMELMRQGLSNAEICRQLGIHRKTDVRWRHGRRARDQGAGRTRYYAPIAPQRQRQPLTARYLSEEERVRKIPRRRSRFSGPVLIIDQRPFPPEDRSTPGAWEGDLVMGRQNRSAIATLVERTTRFTILLPIDAANRSRSLHDQLIATMSVIPPQLRTSITWDQGWEMALHNEIAAALGNQVYFCDPHSPWQRGTNENTNRLVRDYFPKQSDLSVHSPGRIAEVAAELNQRPRRVLDWATPEARFATLMKTYTSA